MSRSLLGRWPQGKRAAVSLSFDDAVLSQLDHALPILDRYGMRGTFYVNPGEGSLFERHLDRWRAAHREGHELANHTISHPCSNKHSFVSPEHGLEHWTLERIEEDILTATQRLQLLIPDLGPISFAYPCGEAFVGEGATYASYIPVVARHFRVARGVGPYGAASLGNDPRTCDLYYLNSWMVTELSAEEMIAQLKPVVAAGHWAIFCFHGIGGDHLSTSTEAFEGLVRYLHENRGKIWTDTVCTVGSHLATSTDARHSITN